jgi:hypothetical protein
MSVAEWPHDIEGSTDLAEMRLLKMTDPLEKVFFGLSTKILKTAGALFIHQGTKRIGSTAWKLKDLQPSRRL